MNVSSLVGLLGFIAACFLAALIGALFRPCDWYERLAKPSWRPSNRLFAPVWTILYLMIAISGLLVWLESGFAGAALPLAIYALQLLLNAAWTPLVFGLHRLDLGFFDIVLVWLLIIVTTLLFYPIHAGAAALLIPYLGWVTFAAALNWAVWRLNPRWRLKATERSPHRPRRHARLFHPSGRNDAPTASKSASNITTGISPSDAKR